MNARRCEEVRRILVQSRLQGFLVTFLPHVRYLTGFSGSNGVVLIRQEEVILLTDSRYREQAAAEAQGARVLITRGGALNGIAAARLVRKKERIGFEAASLSFASHNKLKKFLEGATLVPTDSLIEEIRIQKDESEISAIRRAVAITQRVFKKILTILKAGIQERDLAAEIAYLHRTYGADSDAFEPIVASGVRGALPHGRATSKKLQNGEMVTIDLGCTVEGYHSDLTRTVCLGKPAKELTVAYRAVLDAQEKSLAALRAGIRARVVDGIARKYLESKGFGRYFIHSLGHGIGLEIHERPEVSMRAKGVLKENSVVTVEPGVYIPHVGGVRIEDDVVIRREGIEVLTDAPKELMML